MPYHARSWRTGALALAVMLAAGCGALARPDSAAKEWMQAFAVQDGVKLSELTCDANQGALTAGTSMVAGLGFLASFVTGSAKPQLGVEELQYQTANSSGDSATVKVTGSLRVSVLGIAHSQSVDFALPMRWERGKWRACGG